MKVSRSSFRSHIYASFRLVSGKPSGQLVVCPTTTAADSDVEGTPTMIAVDPIVGDIEES